MNYDAAPPVNSKTADEQSKHVLMMADAEGLLTYRYPVDMTNPVAVESVLGELGPDAVMPDDPLGVYYLVYVPTYGDERIPMLLAESEPRVFVLGLAARAGRDTLAKFLYRWSLVPA